MAASRDVPRGGPFESVHGGSRRWTRSSFDLTPAHQQRFEEDDESQLRYAVRNEAS